jgi:hypothetical protein
MKKYLLYMGLSLILFIGCTDDYIEDVQDSKETEQSTRALDFIATDYYWYKGEKFPLAKKEGKYFVLYDESVSQVRMQSFKSTVSENAFLYPGTDMSGKNAAKFKTAKWTILENVDLATLTAKSRELFYIAPYYITQDGHECGLTNMFYVKLKDKDEKKVLDKLVEDNKLTFIGHDIYAPEWVSIACDNNSTGNALDMANLFYESGAFLAAEPELMSYKIDTPHLNDPYFNSQWGLYNYGTNPGAAGKANIDIGLMAAREWSAGSSTIIVAVVDEGVQLNHPDLPNMYSQSLDATNNSAPQINIYGEHGTACAGIIGATANNSLGVAGIAPNV